MRVLFVLCAVMLPLVGPTGLDMQRVFAKAAPDYGIFVELRITRVLLGLLAGGALALGGGLFQAMLRDSLATPYTLGVSAGAALGAVVVLALDLERILGFPALWLGSMAGAGAVLVMVAGASWKGGHHFRRPAAAHGNLAQQHLLGLHPADLRRGARAPLVFDHAVAAGQRRFGQLHGARSCSRSRSRYLARSCCVRLAPGT